MSRQHLYPCVQCGVYGVAHYRLVQVVPLTEPAPYDLVLLCTACAKEAA